MGTTSRILGGMVAMALAVTLQSTASQAASDPVSAGHDLDEAISTPRSDTVYPRIGHRDIDALSYDLDLSWNRRSRVLTGRTTLVFRAATDARKIRLDFGAPLEATHVTFDGRRVGSDHRGKNLVIDQGIERNERHTLRIDYRGRPESVRWPTERSDGTRAGWLVTRSGEVGTLQEPYGAFTWFPVNDHPSDKAFYSFTIDAPRGWTGIANGELTSQTTGADGRTVTHWTMDRPASSYLVTVAIGDYTATHDTSSSGVPITYWVPTGSPSVLDKVRAASSAIDWLEDRLGPYPFKTLGVVVIHSRSAMETQSTITLGDDDYPLSEPVIVHELAHQWYGDLVTPTDWSDFWMNEGMAMHIQDAWSAEDEGRALVAPVGDRAYDEEWLRYEYGPPARYKPEAFGMSNVYFGAELMWDDVLRHVGWERYWQLVREWPQAHPYGNATYDQIVGWWSDHTGLGTRFFDRWLRGRQTPARIPLTFPGASSVDHRAARTARPARRTADDTDPAELALIRAALVHVASRLDDHAERHDGTYPEFDEGNRFAEQVVGNADGMATARYIPDESRTSYCVVPEHYLFEIDFAYDSGAGAVVDAPGHEFPADSVCDRLWPVLERTGALQRNTRDLLDLLYTVPNAPTSRAELLAAQSADHGYLFPPRASEFRVADYAATTSGFQVCALDERGGAVTFTPEVPIEPPYFSLRTFPYGDTCTYAE